MLGTPVYKPVQLRSWLNGRTMIHGPKHINYLPRTIDLSWHGLQHESMMPFFLMLLQFDQEDVRS